MVLLKDKPIPKYMFLKNRCEIFQPKVKQSLQSAKNVHTYTRRNVDRYEQPAEYQ